MSSTESTKARRVSDVGEEDKQPKRPRLMQPDAVVVVGGKEFQYYSGHLLSISEYFEGAFRGDMKEGVTKRIEFPDKDPADWKLLMSILDPFSDDQIDESNVRQVLPWFDMFCIGPAMGKCDRALRESFPYTYQAPAKASHRTFAFAGTYQYLMMQAIRFNLPLTKKSGFFMARNVLGRNPAPLTELSSDQVRSICSMMAKYEECREELLRSFKRYIPPSLQKEKHDEDFFKNKCLPDAIYYYHKSVVAEQRK